MYFMVRKKLFTFKLNAHAMYVTKSSSWDGRGKRTDTNCWPYNWEVTLKQYTWHMWQRNKCLSVNKIFQKTNQYLMYNHSECAKYFKLLLSKLQVQWILRKRNSWTQNLRTQNRILYRTCLHSLTRKKKRRKKKINVHVKIYLILLSFYTSKSGKTLTLKNTSQ